MFTELMILITASAFALAVIFGVIAIQKKLDEIIVILNVIVKDVRSIRVDGQVENERSD